jgi:protein tyrosine/serine phosphatase
MVSSRKRYFCGLLILLVIPLIWWGLRAFVPTEEGTKKAEEWAQAVMKPGLPNLHKINDQVYRGAQPEKGGYEELAKMGIKTVICLRESDPDLDAVQEAKLECIHIPVKTWHPTDEEVIQFLQTVTDKSKQPIFIHCKHGSDRTGTMCAIYRIAVEGWSKNDAIQEMTKGDYGFHAIWTNLIKFIQGLDVDSLKKNAGLKDK